MQEQDNLDALFNPEVDMGDTGSKQSDEYQASADKGKNGIYQAVIRFIPWYQNPKGSITEKWVSWLVDPVTQRGRFVDCPSSIGKPSPLSDMYRRLKKSESIQEQKKAEVFSRRHGYASLIQVLKDENQPELEGKILVYRFGKKIWEKINAEKKPLLGDPHEPFDMLKGKAFHLVITKVSGFNNYDQSKFIDKVIPLCMRNEAGKLNPITPTTDKMLVFNYLKENSPDLIKYGYREWDQETHDYVNHVILAVTGQAAMPGNYASINSAARQSTSTTPPQKSGSSGITSTNINIDDLNADSISNINEIPGVDFPEINQPFSPLGNLDDVLSNM